jgi:hypothetical protein
MSVLAEAVGFIAEEGIANSPTFMSRRDIVTEIDLSSRWQRNVSAGIDQSKKQIVAKNGASFTN